MHCTLYEGRQCYIQGFPRVSKRSVSVKLGNVKCIHAVTRVLTYLDRRSTLRLNLKVFSFKQSSLLVVIIACTGIYKLGKGGEGRWGGGSKMLNTPSTVKYEIEGTLITGEREERGWEGETHLPSDSMHTRTPPSSAAGNPL